MDAPIQVIINGKQRHGNEVCDVNVLGILDKVDERSRDEINSHQDVVTECCQGQKVAQVCRNDNQRNSKTRMKPRVVSLKEPAMDAWRLQKPPAVGLSKGDHQRADGHD